MNPYTIAYALGYFYGRAYPATEVEFLEIPEQDHYHRENIGFLHGFQSGQRDFREIDLPKQAEAAEIQAEEIL